MKVIHTDKWDMSEGISYSLIELDGQEYHRHTKIINGEPFDHHKEVFSEGMVNGMFVTSGAPRLQAKKFAMAAFDRVENDAEKK